MSLFGVANHCRGDFSPKEWNSEADYMIMDDIPWDEFEKSRGFPDPRALLTGQDQLEVRANMSLSHRESRLSLYFFLKFMISTVSVQQVTVRLKPKCQL